MAVVPSPDALGVVKSQPVTPVYQDPNAANGAFGQDSAKAMQSTGEQLQQASNKFAQVAQRVQTRADVVARARDLSAYHQAVTAEAQRVATEEDLSDPQTVKKFAQFTVDKMNDTLQNHQGSPDSRVLLTPSLESTRSSVMDTVSAQSLKAQKDVVNGTLDTELNRNVKAVMDSPGTLYDRLQAWKSRVDEMAPGLGTVDAHHWQQYGDQEITRSVVSSFIDKGQYDAAEKVLNTPGVTDVLGGDVQRSLNAKLISGRAALNKQQNAGLLKLQYVQQIMGPDFKFTPAIRAKIAGISDPAQPKTLSEKVAELQKVLDGAKDAQGNPLTVTPQMIEKMAGAGGAEGSPFADKDLGVMASLHSKIMDGTATPQDRLNFQVAATNYTQERFDEKNGIRLPGKVLPAPMQDALDHAGLKLSTRPNSPTPGEQPTGPAAPQLDGNTSLDIFGNARNLSGPVPAGARLAAGTPVVGSLFTSPQMVQVFSSVEPMERDLAKILQDDPRLRGSNSAAERNAITEQLNLTSGAFDTSTRFQNHLIGVDKFLQQKQAQAQQILNRGPGGSSSEEYLWARRAADQIANMRFHLNVPPTIKASEVPKWTADHPGQPFVRSEDGKVFFPNGSK